jgi:alanine racemase
LGQASPDDVRWGASANVRFTLNDLEDINHWKQCGAPVTFHANIDTGMGRLGILPGEVAEFMDKIRGEGLLFEGLCTHLAKADAPDSGAISLQLFHFRKVLNALRASGFMPSVIHYGNSSAVMRYPLEECTMVRPGVALYGCKPDPRQEFPLSLKPVMGLKARIVKMKRVEAGVPISYGGAYVTPAQTVIATIAIGYGQGFPRQLGNRGSVLIRGKRYGIAGRVTMDFIMVDAGANPDMAVGDEVVAMGTQRSQCILPDDIALLCDTIGYEIMCSISPCIDRCYILGGKTEKIEHGRPF